MTSRPSTAAPILAVLAMLAAVLGAYIGGYFWLGPVQHSFMYFGEEEGGPPDMVREFPTHWLCRVYEPAGKVESWFRGKKVGIWDRQ